MMIKLLRRVRRAEEKELALSRKQYEKYFESFQQGYEVMYEELN